MLRCDPLPEDERDGRMVDRFPIVPPCSSALRHTGGLSARTGRALNETRNVAASPRASN